MTEMRGRPRFNANYFGGTLLRASHAKLHRPISSTLPMHFVFHSSDLNRGHSFLLKANRLLIQKILRRHKTKVRLLNLRLQHGLIHLVLRSRSRKKTQDFLRIFAGLVPRLILKAEKSNPRLKTQRFWKFRPYSVYLQSFHHYGMNRLLKEFAWVSDFIITVQNLNSS